jgi:hypothetical protein
MTTGPQLGPSSLTLVAAYMLKPGLIATSACCRKHGLEPSTLRDVLSRDKDLKVATDGSGSLHYVCSMGHNHSSSDSGNNMRRHMLDTSTTAGVQGHGRGLKQFIPAEMADPSPSSLPASSTGVPILHR